MYHMDISLLFTSGVVAGVISSLISFYSNRKLKDVDYSYSYKKYILEKRQKAYEKIEQLFSSLRMIDIGNNQVIYSLFSMQGNINPLVRYNELICEITSSDMWLSSKMVSKVQKLNFLIVEIMQKQKDPNDRDALLVLGNSYGEKLGVILGHLLELYFQDLLCLNDIEKFRQDKVKEFGENVHKL